MYTIIMLHVPLLPFPDQFFRNSSRYVHIKDMVLESVAILNYSWYKMNRSCAMGLGPASSATQHNNCANEAFSTREQSLAVRSIAAMFESCVQVFICELVHVTAWLGLCTIIY